eukprot:2777296-Pleurochrysis_carterae.AAC.3
MDSPRRGSNSPRSSQGCIPTFTAPDHDRRALFNSSVDWNDNDPAVTRERPSFGHTQTAG